MAEPLPELSRTRVPDTPPVCLPPGPKGQAAAGRTAIRLTPGDSTIKLLPRFGRKLEWLRDGWRADPETDIGEPVGPLTIGEETIVPQADEALGQDVK